MTESMRQVVRSPEQVELHVPIAGPTSRMLAYAVDAAVLFAVQATLWSAVLLALPALAGRLYTAARTAVRGGGAPDSISGLIMTAFGIVLVVQLVLEFGYFVLFDRIADGRSPGKRVMRLRVVQDGGFPITLRQSIIRNLLRVADSLPWSYLVGLVAIILSPEGKRLGDVAAGTVVVRLDRPPAPEPLLPNPGVRDAFRFERRQIARMGPTEIALAVETCRRLPVLDDDRKTQVLERTVGALCTRIGHPPVAPAERETFLQALVAQLGAR